MPYLDSLSTDWYADDGLLQRLLDRYAPDADRDRLIAWGPTVAGRLALLAEQSARPEHAPRLRRYDAYGERADEVVLPASTREALAVAHGAERLGAVHGDPWAHYAMIYLLAQNGEAGVACSLACTDGLVRALEALGDGAVHADVAAAVRAATPDRYLHGAQFVTEIQGGSDVPANETRATRDGDVFRLHGRKWFCSNINADWFLVTARPDDADAVGMFLVPARPAGTDVARNGYTIDRLKDKLGTRELATAEATFEGALAYAVGSADRGLANLLRYVLTPSRFACVLFAAGALRRAERIVQAYTSLREAFGRPIADYPLVQDTLRQVTEARERTLGCAFELLRLWEAAEAADYEGPAAADFRVLLSLAKPVLTAQATRLLHESMMLLGGNGIEERFSPLPRLYRDAVIMETWEGPHNVLYTQALRDLIRFDMDPEAFVTRVAGEGHAGLGRELAEAVVVAGAGGADIGRGGVSDGTLQVAITATPLVWGVGEKAVD